MRSFSQLVKEDRKNYESKALLASEITSYINKVKKQIPVDVQKAIYLTSKYNIGSAEQLDRIREANKSKLKELVDELNIPLSELEDLWTLMKSMKSNYRLMPQYMSAAEREYIEQGKLAMDDLTIDLKTTAGRSAVSKMYTPLVYKIVGQYLGRSRMDKAELISAGLLGLANAMNDWKPEPDEKTGKVVPFKTYAGYRIKQQILNDMNQLSHTLSGGNWYNTDKYGAAMFDAISLDGVPSGDEFNQDHMDELGAVDKPDKDDESKWKKLFKILEKTFSQRDVNVFYRYFGLNGYPMEKSKDIAKSYGMSEGNIQNSILKKMIKFIKSNRQVMDILADIQDIYTESLMCSMIGMTKEQIIETLANNDMYILLEDVNRWNNQTVFKGAVLRALDNFVSKDQAIIKDMLKGGFESIDSMIRKHKNLMVEFLRRMDPTANNFRTDGDVIAAMTNVSELVAHHKVQL